MVHGTEETVSARGAFRMCARDAGRKSPDALEMKKKRMTANAEVGTAERGGLKSNLRPRRMRRSRPVRYFPARGWRANRSKSLLCDDADYDDDDDDDVVAADDDNDAGPALGVSHG